MALSPKNRGGTGQSVLAIRDKHLYFTERMVVCQGVLRRLGKCCAGGRAEMWFRVGQERRGIGWEGHQKAECCSVKDVTELMLSPAFYMIQSFT